MSIDLSNVIALALGSDDVLQIQDAIGTVLWQKIIYYNVSISAGSNGSVSVNGVTGNYSQSVPSGTVLTIEGTGNTGYNFDEWSDGNTDNPRTITVTGDLTLTAAFESAAEYFYVEDVSGSDNTLSITKTFFDAPDVEVFYSTDQQNWSSMGTTSDTAITATIPANGKLYLKATADTWSDDGTDWNYINASGAHNVGGNIMSLLYGDNYTNQTTFPTGSAYNFYGLFSVMIGTSHLISAEDLILPATTLAESCYAYMFSECTSLTTAPATLPATILAQSCYQGMFNECRALTTAPALPATTLNSSCYQYMFQNCTSLTTAPVLPATTLTNYCYSNMFRGCTSLTTAPVLPVTTLGNGCYQGMFNGCSSLNNVTTYADNISATNCTNNWLKNVSATGDFYNLGSATYTSGANGIPSGWTEHTSL